MASTKGEFTVRDGIVLRTRTWPTEVPKGRVVIVHGLAALQGCPEAEPRQARQDFVRRSPMQHRDLTLLQIERQ